MTIREARASDAKAIAYVHIESSRHAYAPLAKEWPTPDWEARRTQWASLLVASQTDTKRADFVAELNEGVVAFIDAGPARRKDVGAEVEIYVIHVLPEHRGKGLGSELWRAATKRLRGESLRAMYVNTLAELRCCAFYEARGGKVASRSPRVFHGGAVTDVVYLWPTGSSSELIVRTLGAGL